MTTLIDTIQPEDSHLVNALEDHGLNGRTPDEYVTNYLNGVLSIIRDVPASYRSYGPWWPALKKLLVEIGASDVVGNIIDSGTAEIYQREKPELTVIAAHLYSAERTEMGCIYSTEHVLPVNADADDTEPYLYFSNDEEMEQLIAIRG